MKKLNNFINCLNVLKTANFDQAYEDPIYRSGVTFQFNLTFELAWKATQAIMLSDGAPAETGSPREILMLAYKLGYIDGENVWITMLKRRNEAVHIYDEDRIDELMLLIKDSFIPAFEALAQTLKAKLAQIGEEETL